MPNINNIVGEARGITASDRAVTAWKRIQDNPASIVLVRGTPPAPLSAQTVRIEFTRGSGQEGAGEAGVSDIRLATVFGVRDHPTVTNTDIRRGDRFKYNDTQFQVSSVARYAGEVQAIADVYDSRG
jgi:hypothetical protein